MTSGERMFPSARAATFSAVTSNGDGGAPTF
jgi:hypothetical protein